MADIGEVNGIFSLSDIPFDEETRNVVKNMNLSSQAQVTYPNSNIYSAIKSDLTPLTGLQLTGLFDQYLTTYSYPYKTFTNWNDFVQGYYKYMQANNVNLQFSNGLYKGFFEDFGTIYGIEINSGNSGEVEDPGDWESIFSFSTNPTLFSPTNPNNPVILAFNQFVSSLQPGDYPTSGQPTGTNAAKFVEKYQSFLANNLTSVGDINTAFVDTTATQATKDAYQNLASYQLVYDTWAKSPTIPSGFSAFMNTFYNYEIKTKGYFTPGDSAEDFFNAVQNLNATNILPVELPNSSISGTGSVALLVLNKILALLIKLIKALQDVGIVQSQRLTYYTNFQNAYTGMQSQIPVFTAGQTIKLQDGTTITSPLGITGKGDKATAAANARNDLNSSFNGIITDNLRSLRDIQSNNAKQLQSNINTTNDAVNQQVDMVSSFIQTLQSLLGSILR